ncbi:MAG: hypothetical protein ACPGSD_10435 [Flavobacteriales bacterium]
MYQLKNVFLITILFYFWGCSPIHKQSVEDKRWSEIMENFSSYEVDKFFNEYPDSKHYTSLLEFMKQVEVDEDLFDPPPCCRNFRSIQMINKDSVRIDDEKYPISALEHTIYSILQGYYSKATFLDHLGVERIFSNSVFSISLKDSIPVNQDVLVKVKKATKTYTDSIVQVWYPKGYPVELVNSEFEKKVNFNMILSWRKSPPKPPKPPAY